MDAPPGFRRVRVDGARLFLQEGVGEWLEEALASGFESIPAQKRTPVQGRGMHFTFETPDGRAFARQVLRGGFFSFMGPRLLGAGRVFNELRMLKAAAGLGLHVPEVLGFSVRGGLFKRIHVVYREIEEVRTLEEAVRHGRPGLEPAARAVRKMHDGGLVHGDLNCRNILLKESRVYFVDFDRARQDRSETAHRKELARLYRSLAKELEEDFTEKLRRRLVEAYVGEPDESLLRLCEKGVKAHRVLWKKKAKAAS